MSDIRIVWDDAVAHGDWLLRPLSSSTEHVVVSEPAVFGTGDGVRTQFQLSKPPVIDLAEKIFRNDWQGNRRLYPTPRTNLFRYSNDFSNAAWGNATAIRTTGYPAPDGSDNGTLITVQHANSCAIFQSVVLPEAQSAFSLYVAPGSSSTLTLRYVSFDTNIIVTFNLATGGVSNPLIGKIEASQGGWYRCSIAPAMTGADLDGQLYAYLATNAGTQFTADIGNTMRVFGAQVEVGLAPTPYIPTGNAAVTVTDYSASATGLITMGQVPAIGAALTWTGSYSKPISVGTGDLESGADLATAMLLSIFTDAMAASDDVIPDGTGDPRGWWGDQFDPDEPLGSKLWLLHREKQTRTTLNRAYDYLVEALKWLVDDGVVARFEITVEWVRESFLGAQIIAYSPDGTSLHTGKYLWAWNGIN
ncbi:phage GP46 family protein [Achromobacter marplatensis]|uniref:Phage gp46-like protein n=1 Tax=Achromobacter marplatensis TaxID=470868 RepID=A0ABX9G9H6_9BURK|nr:phage GP46 family protein [Achromobacter marplatensis]RBP19826.1 phage gp46-like protein [Achromobacter marplatensis]CAB3636782.1 hypothetical protein LMG26219_01726 [Achromobacter marplatensis]